ncbi:hypothetical protein LOTGIDRAFT_185567 [Lottia gigantea]|uniref:HMG box domain-containing protein n=1 Tax=Lottia gigantea TaxID=225164 RepID=V4BA89_LOTGI|nr:hypothetical protein LOTGIDRAFT_185567 [Lottia gigantea]ESP02837.1 hypothetical protein LOTGIDRAFT_185567 [Lottia gigantea]
MSENTLQLAIKYASRVRKLQLAERISQLAQEKTQEEDEIEEDNLLHTNEITDWSNANGHNDNNEEEMEEENEEEEETINEDDNDEEEEKPVGLLIGSKSKPSKPAPPTIVGRSNPFKVSTQEKIKKQNVKGTQIFDGMNKKIEKTKSSPFMPITTKISKSNQKKVPSQTKIFTAKGDKVNKTETDKVSKKTPNAFELWLEENKDDLKEESPELDDEGFGIMAAEKYRALTKDDRQIWIQKAKEMKSSGANENCELKKRKREEEEITSNKKSNINADIVKKPLSQQTNSKLSNFAFSKDS